jgi:hypothetical protein
MPVLALGGESGVGPRCSRSCRAWPRACGTVCCRLRPLSAQREGRGIRRQAAHLLCGPGTRVLAVSPRWRWGGVPYGKILFLSTTMQIPSLLLARRWDRFDNSGRREYGVASVPASPLAGLFRFRSAPGRQPWPDAALFAGAPCVERRVPGCLRRTHPGDLSSQARGGRTLSVSLSPANVLGY